MNRGLLAVGALIVAGSVVALWLIMRTDEPATVTPSTPVAGDPHETRTLPPKAGPGVTVNPALPEQPSIPGGSSDNVTEYSVGNVAVRDHRSGDHAARDVPPSVHPPGHRAIDSKVTWDISQKVRAVTKDCAASVPKDARGAQPKVEGQIIIAIKDKQLAITGATIQVRDVTSGGDTLKQCIEQKSVGLSTTAGDELDVQDYSITLSIDLP